MLQLRTLDIKSFFFIALIIFLGVLLFQTVSPFLSIIIVCLIIAQLFQPVYKWIQNNTGSIGLASTVSVLSSILLVVIPVIIITVAIISEVANVFVTVTDFLRDTNRVETTVITSVNSVNERLASLGIEARIKLPENRQELRAQIDQVVRAIIDEVSKVPGDLISFATNFTAELARISANFLFVAFIFILTLSYMFPLYERLPQIVRRISPLDNELDSLLIVKFRETTSAVVLGNFVVAIAQASAVLIMLLLLGIGSPALLWAIMVVLSLVPVGSGLVWFPVGVYLIATGNPVGGVVLIAYSAVIINVIEALLRPVLLKGRVHLHPLLILFSVLGGIGLFGAIGLIYGPLVAVFFTSLMEVYNQRYVVGTVRGNEEIPAEVKPKAQAKKR